MKDFCSRRFDYGSSEPLLQKRHPQRIKTFGFPPAGALFWAVLFLSLDWGAWATAAVLPIAAVDAFARKKRLQQKDLPVALPLILVAVLRDYLALFYQTCAFLSRYYLAPGLLLIPLLPPLSLIVPGVQLLTGSVVYIVKRPRLNFLSFQIFFLLEQLSYQAGVWWGCLKNLHFTPVAPKPVGIRTPKDLACRWN
jgi:hypothetical protein